MGTDKLDAYLAEQDKKKKELRETSEIENKKWEEERQEFTAAFRSLETKTIRSQMRKVTDSLKKSNYVVDIPTDKGAVHYPHLSYTIKAPRGLKSIQVIFIGNYDSKKVTIQVIKNSGKTENSYEPSEITDDLIEGIILEEIKSL